MSSFRYTSPSGQVLELDGDVAYTGIAEDVRSNKWAFDLSSTGAVSGLSRSAREARVSLVATSLAYADTVCQTFEYDAAHYAVNGPATLTAYGEWEQGGLVVAERLKDVNRDNVILECDVLLLDGVWRKTTVIHLEPGAGSTPLDTGLDYPTDFEFDYHGTSPSSEITTLSSGGCMVGLTFFGSCSNPYVRIGTNIYGVNASASAGERIVVDPTKRHTVGRSVYRVGQFGEITNLYDYRRRGTEGSGTYIFQSLEAGTYDVSWPQSFGVDIALIEERGVLPWS